MRGRRLKSLVMSVAAVGMMMPSGARAWGPQGHTIIWKVAQTRLSPAARARLHAIETAEGASITVTYPETNARTHRTTTRVCGSGNDQALANWADCVRYSPDVAYNHTADYHFDDMPWCGDIPPKPSYCINGACGSTQLEIYLDTLRNGHDPRPRFEALAYVIHFVGDLHQPLHTITNGLPHNSDNGGNGILVSVDTHYISHNPAGYNLHKLWDGGILSVTPGLPDAQGRAQSLEQSVAQLATQNAATWEAHDRQALAQLTAQPRSPSEPAPVRGDVWAREAHPIGVEAYNRLPRRPQCGARRLAVQPLDADYVDHFTDAVRTQLAKAAVRLADVLNETLG